MSAGTLLATAPGDVRWLAYIDDGVEWAAAYFRGRLVRRDAAGWWTNDAVGKRVSLTEEDVELLRGTGPDDPPIWPEVSGLAALEDRRAIVRRVADVEPERVSFLWPARIPLAKVTALDGDPGLGKSTIGYDIAARVSTGSPMPGESEVTIPPSSVIVLTAEDGIADTVRPRLDSAGADLERIIVLEAVRPAEGPARLVELPRDLSVVEQVVREFRAALVLIDPLMAYLGADVNSYRDQDVRRALLHPLAKLAERTGAAVLFVRHLTKGGGSNAIYRGGGSIGITAAVRSSLLVAPDPNDEGRRVLAVSKSNIAPPCPALAYRLVPDEFRDCVQILWEGTTDHRADELLALPVDEDERSSQDEAVEFLLDLLAEGPIEAQEAKRLAKRAGIAERTLDRARRRAGARTRREGFGPGAVYRWELMPAHARHARQPSENGAHGTHDADGGEDGEAVALVLSAFPSTEVEQ